MNIIQISSHKISSKVIFINTTLSNNTMLKLINSDLISSLKINNFQSINDFFIENSRVQTELFNLIELINASSLIKFKRNKTCY